MSVYTVRFGLAGVFSNSTVLLYTAPAGVASVVTDILVTNVGGSAAIYNVHVTSGAVTYYLMASQTQGALTTDHLQVRARMLVGDGLYITSANTMPITCTVTGYELTL